MKAEGISRRHAIELLRADHGGTEGGGKIVKNSTRQKLANVIAADVDDALLIEQVVGYYSATLTRTPTAMDFLAMNGITGEAIERFRIGLSDRTLGYRIPKGKPDVTKRRTTPEREALATLAAEADGDHE